MKPTDSFDFYSKLLLKIIKGFINNIVKVSTKSILFLFGFIKKKIHQIAYFLMESLTRDELFRLIIFIIYFIFTDRKSQKKIKYNKTAAPNVLWRILAFLIYMPIWKQFVFPCFMFVAERTPPIDMTFNFEFVLAVNQVFNFMNIIEKMLSHKISFIAIYNTFLYYVPRGIVKLVPEKIFHLPMFIRYHMIISSFLMIFYPFFDIPYKQLAGIIDSPARSIYLETTTKDLGLACNLSLLMVFFYCITLGYYTWLACRGKSFTNVKGFFDIVIRDHLGYDCLYKGEKWSEYGMDEFINYFDDNNDS